MSFYSPCDMEIDGYDLRMTCMACPEQYDVFRGGSQVGYLRLRHGRFAADVPDAGRRTVYQSYPVGDGIFDNEVERENELRAAIRAIHAVREGGTTRDELVEKYEAMLFTANAETHDILTEIVEDLRGLT